VGYFFVFFKDLYNNFFMEIIFTIMKNWTWLRTLSLGTQQDQIIPPLHRSRACDNKNY
jgi:hypothetical protein